MEDALTSLKTGLVRSAIAAAALVGAVTLASQAQAQGPLVACSPSHECWHTHNRWAYPPSSGITIHTEHWVRAQGWPVAWRTDRYERGYYRSGVWISF